MAEHNALYRRALYYDIALRRDVSREADFIVQLYQHHTGKPLQSLVDIACGPGYYARQLARRGIKTCGLDLNQEMVNMAREQAMAEGVAIDWLTADMRSFQLPQPVDMAITMFDSLDALIHNEDLIQHFRAVAHNLYPGGLYLVDVCHPRNLSHDVYGPFRYSGERDGIEVEIIWGTNNPRYDLVTNSTRAALEVHVNDNGRKQIIYDEADERLLLPQELTLLAMLSGMLQVIGWYGDYTLHQPLDHSPASQRLICVFQKNSVLP